MIGIGVPNGVVNLPTVHMVQTFRGNYVMDHTSFTPVQPANDLYFGTFFYSDSAQNKVWAATTTVLSGAQRSYLAGEGGYDRDPFTPSRGVIALFPFDFDGVQGAIKAKGDEKWITFRGMYDNTITFTAVDGDGYGADDVLSAAEFGYREARGTWRYQMNEEASMAASIPYSGIAGIDGRCSTITNKYNTVLGVATHNVPHSLGKFKIIP